MTKYTEKIVDVSTGEETLREYSTEEIAELKAEQKKIDEKIALKKAEIDNRQMNRSAILTKLGITDDEAKLLLS